MVSTIIYFLKHLSEFITELRRTVEIVEQMRDELASIDKEVRDFIDRNPVNRKE